MNIEPLQEAQFTFQWLNEYYSLSCGCNLRSADKPPLTFLYLKWNQLYSANSLSTWENLIVGCKCIVNYSCNNWSVKKRMDATKLKENTIHGKDQL
ncbi:uncharacterized protein isoform X2 [Rhodnius prolixus]|uniref:uncharacterized protein isoform X2 n=1 Tax=Rhodnius prolixus TaxID=13249 RepID=UPI003D189175